MILRLKDTMLIVGDKQSSRAELRSIFRDAYNLLEAESINQALLLLEQNDSCIACILVDMSTLKLDDLRSLMACAHAETEKAIPIVIVVDPAVGSDKEDLAFMMGASDVILKPFSRISIQRRIEVLVDLFQHKWSLEKLLSKQSEKIRDTNQTMLDTLSAIIEYRSTESGNHVLRIRRFTQLLLQEVARCCPEYELTEDTINTISSAAALHDIGKISIPDAILNKPGPLTDEEFEIMKTHSTVGSELVRQLSPMGEEMFLRYAYNISLYHHERWDGKGYPAGLKGDDIPICAQVVGFTDAFDALTTNRVYKPAYPYQSAINMLLNGECGSFSPKLLECFKHIRDQFIDLARKYSDGYSPKYDAISVPLPGPVWKNSSYNSLELSQAKYQTLLHYIDDTVIELDLDNNLYQVVYNPNPDLDSIIPSASFNDIIESLRTSSNIHPEDIPLLDEMYRFITDDLFRLKLRRRSFFLRLFSPIADDYLIYELQFLRVESGSGGHRIVTAIWRRANNIHFSQGIKQNNLYYSPALYGLVSIALRCRSDRELSIDAGASELYSLTGFTEIDIKHLFGSKLINMVLPKDQKLFEASISQALRKGGKTEVEFRMLRKNRDPIWVLAKCRPHVEDDGQEYLYFAMHDNSESKKVHQKLIADIQRNQTLIDQSGSIVFDWDLLSDNMYCSPRWVEHFGYVPVSENYDSQLGIATHFHPDDLILVRESIEQIKQGTISVIKEVRIANAEGKYLWTKITATGCRDENGALVRIIGILQDIDDLKRSAIAMKEQADRDSLTKLLNKASCQRLVSDYLSMANGENMAGLLILDLDNFKIINDTFGHLFGDVVLTHVGAALRGLFRSHDIIGRIGGDEFLVLVKDIPGETPLIERCRALLDTLNLLLQKLTPDLPVSCSVGASLYPIHGKHYNELFLKADEALYTAKNRGKNQYRIYDATYRHLLDDSNISRTTEIDSDDPSAVTNESFERFVFHCLYESRDIEATINSLLSFIGSSFNVSRVYIFENNDDNTACSNTFEWCNQGVEPQIDNLQDVSYITDIPGWPEVYNSNNIFFCTDISQLDAPFRAILEPQGIKSMLHYTIMDDGVFRGYIGFDECSFNRIWTQEQLDQLQFLAETMSVFLLNHRKRQKEKAD